MNPRLPDAVCRRHAAHFQRAPQQMAYAPGRVEVLGNHTDYNGGLTLSAAVDCGICAALSANDLGQVRLLAMDLESSFACKLPVTPAVVEEVRQAEQGWANYILGVAYALPLGSGRHGGFDLTVGGDMPRGSGLSSSAALEVASAMAMAAATQTTFAMLDLARLCQRAEHEFAGARCGLLDQISVIAGQTNALVAIDFQNLAVRLIALPPQLVFLIADTHTHHTLAESVYNERRAQCEAAVRFFSKNLRRPVQTLRDVVGEELERVAPEMPAVEARRARHVIGETQRVGEAIAALGAGDVKKFGELMFASHESSRVNFENSCPELDCLVDCARSIPEVLGARLSGGGFGGSAVVLTLAEHAAGVAEALKAAFYDKFRRQPTVRVAKPSTGARLL